MPTNVYKSTRIWTRMTNYDIPQTATLSVSKREGLDCTELARQMWRAGIRARITPNISTLPWLEPGCAVTFESRSKQAIRDAWEVARTSAGLRCAHLNIQGTFQGCVHDFLRPSACPDKEN